MKAERLAELAEKAVKEAVRLGVSDASASCYSVVEKMVRFSNNSVTVTKNLVNIELSIYLAKEKRRIVGSSTNPSLVGVREFVDRLISACSHLPMSLDYTPLPTGSRHTPPHVKTASQPSRRLLEACEEAVEAALSEGAKRASGALTSTEVALCLSTSTGASGRDAYGSTVLNVRSFLESDASGHGLSCAPGLKSIAPEEAGRRSGEYARLSAGAKPCEEGVYDVIMGPTVAADLFQHVGAYSSAFYVDAGISFLTGKLGEKVGDDALTIWDDPSAEGGLVQRRFDDEGVSTARKMILKGGRLENYLHNTTTARKFGSQTMGNAGIVVPHPFNLVVEPGDQDVKELVEGVKKGIMVTNNWYTRFQNTRTGEYSTLPRDASFLIENGKITKPVSGIRISDSIPRQLQHLQALSRERHWVEWWEVWLPTLTPWILVRNVPITRALS